MCEEKYLTCDEVLVLGKTSLDMRNEITRLKNALEIAETFLRSHSGTKKVLKRIAETKE